MDAAELLAGEDALVLDTSAWWRTLSLPDELASRMQDAMT